MPVRQSVNLNIFFNCKYKCDYKHFFIQTHLCSTLLKASFLLSHLLILEILILKLDVLLVFQNKANIETIGF